MLNDSEVSYVELRRNIIIRSAEYKEQSQIRSRSDEGCQSIIFGATMVSLRGDVVDMGILMMSLVLRCRNDHDNELPQSRPRLLAVYMM